MRFMVLMIIKINFIINISLIKMGVGTGSKGQLAGIYGWKVFYSHVVTYK